MARRLTDRGALIKGVCLTRDHGYVVYTLDELNEQNRQHTIIVEWQRPKLFKSGAFPFNVTALSRLDTQSAIVLAIGEYGRVILVDGERTEHEAIPGVQDRGPLRTARLIGEHIYVGGMDRQLYRRIGNNSWKDVADDIRPPASQVGTGFEAIDGFEDKEIYGVGWGGEGWLLEGESWRYLDLPTNHILTDLCCADNGYVYIVGRQSTLIRGRGDRWATVDHRVTAGDFWSVCWFKQEVYLCTSTNLFRLVGNNLVLVPFDGDKPTSCYQLSTNSEVMWLIGGKDWLEFDGVNWSRID